MKLKPRASVRKADGQPNLSKQRSQPADLRGLQDRIIWRKRTTIRPFPGNPRRHPEAQIVALMKNIKSQGWTNPILIDETGTILAGHARCEAATRIGMSHVPTLTITGLTEAQKRAIVISDNRLPEQAVWDFDLLRTHFQKLIDVDFEIELTGFSTGEIDLLLDRPSISESIDPADNLAGITTSPAVSRLGDIWHLGRHRLMCSTALSDDSYLMLLDREIAQMVVTDPPFNAPIQGHAMGRGRVRHREFQMASGEMSAADFTGFLSMAIRLMSAASRDGSIHFIFMDWRHLPELLAAALPNYTDWKNLLVWNKSNAGQGSFYRSKHELITVFKNGTAPHINNFGLGAKGRYRTNVLDYPSVNGLHPARQGELELHPTIKPVALIADLIRDCSRRNGIILDPFGGSGTTILAAERTSRIARLIELDPLYVDVAVRRWENVTGIPARHGSSDLTFSQVAADRGSVRATSES
jgi:DNA modification methylase